MRQECGVGIVEIDIAGDIPAFAAPPTTIEPLPQTDAQAICEALSIDPASVVNTARLDNGPVWQAFELASVADVLALDGTKVRWPAFKAIGLIGPHPGRRGMPL